MKYSKHYVLSIISWIHSVLLFSVIYPFVGSIMKLTGENWIKFSLISVLLFIPVIISWILVRAIKWFLVYILISVLLGISCGYLGYVYGDILSISNYVGGVLTAILSLIISFIHGGAKLSYCELKQDYIARHGSTKDFALEPWETTNILTEPSHIHWIWFILLYVIGILINYTVFLKFLFWIVLIDVFLCFFYKYLNGFHQFIREKKNYANLPITTMKRIQKVILGILFILLLLCVMPSVLYGKERLAGVFHLKLNSNQEQLDDPFFYDSMNSQSSQALNDLLESMDQDPLPIWFSFMLDIISFLFIIGTVCFILFLLYRFIRNTCRVFHQDGEDEILFLDVNKKKERAYYHDRKNHDDHYFSANMKIRRRYKKTIRKATKGDPNTCHTPTELEISANLSDSIQVETLHHCYEKARYSKEGCTDEDIHQLK